MHCWWVVVQTRLPHIQVAVLRVLCWRDCPRVSSVVLIAKPARKKSSNVCYRLATQIHYIIGDEINWTKENGEPRRSSQVQARSGATVSSYGAHGALFFCAWRPRWQADSDPFEFHGSFCLRTFAQSGSPRKTEGQRFPADCGNQGHYEPKQLVIVGRFRFRKCV